jgi:sigma-B regulation protein RsbU (phosphoserine phosphatase)
LAGSGRPTQVLERLNRFVYENSQESRYVTLFYGELDPSRRSLVYVNAGHVPPYLLREQGREERLRCGGPVIGLLEDVALEAGEVVFEPGDLLGVVTDGVTEATGSGPEEFGDRRAVSALAAAAASGAQAALASLVAAVEAWTGPAGCTDDLTVVTLRAT